MRVLVTGAFGNVGNSALNELMNRPVEVTILEIENSKNKRLAKKINNRARVVFGDLRDSDLVNRVVRDQDYIIHTAGIIPPLADRLPEFAREVNVGRISNIINAVKKNNQDAKIFFTSSISVYGDRLNNPLITLEDNLAPGLHDEYAKQKIECENMIRASGIRYSIFRLTYVVSPDKINMDPLMFQMPLDTSLEVCHTKDVGLVLINGIYVKEALGNTFNIAGGKECRTSYRDYLSRMTNIFGLGENLFPEEAFAKDGFHCGYMDTQKEQEMFRYQNHTLEDYFNEVEDKVKLRRPFLKAISPIARKMILKKSPFYESR